MCSRPFFLAVRTVHDATLFRQIIAAFKRRDVMFVDLNQLIDIVLITPLLITSWLFPRILRVQAVMWVCVIKCNLVDSNQSVSHFNQSDRRIWFVEIVPISISTVQFTINISLEAREDYLSHVFFSANHWLLKLHTLNITHGMNITHVIV